MKKSIQNLKPLNSSKMKEIKGGKDEAGKAGVASSTVSRPTF